MHCHQKNYIGGSSPSYLRHLKYIFSFTLPPPSRNLTCLAHVSVVMVLQGDSTEKSY